MTTAEWSLIAGLSMSLALAVGPWMFMVHGKLAVIASKIDDLRDAMQRAAEERQELRETARRQASQLETHDVQLSHLSERLSLL